MHTKIVEVDPRTLKLLKLNARYMRHEEFQKLVSNIQRDGQLTSTPFVCKDGDSYLVLSGNHRVKAAIAAGLSSINVIATDDPLNEAQRIAIQLSHNAISGADDLDILKELYRQIDDLEWKEYCGLDDRMLDMLDKASAQSLSEAHLEFETLSMVFLPDELKKAQAVLQSALDSVKHADHTWIARKSEYDNWLDAQDCVMSACNVKNVATAVSIMLRVFEANITQLQSEFIEVNDARWIPLETIFGRRKIPSSTAKKIIGALRKIQGKNGLKDNELWKGLDYIIDSYLASGGDGKNK